ncbi:hypothetical protein HT031_002080 [Scenedesmus sp. PABB004]|nr:hypothetical protein HT031_002080 [Scenedesmus sp. PABB004]
MASLGKLASGLAERFFYDFSMYRTHFAHKMDYNRYVVLRHNFLLVGGFYFLMTAPFPFKPSFPTMGLCPKGYEGTFVCEKDDKKALAMYKDWKAGRPTPASA